MFVVITGTAIISLPATEWFNVGGIGGIGGSCPKRLIVAASKRRGVRRFFILSFRIGAMYSEFFRGVNPNSDNGLVLVQTNITDGYGNVVADGERFI